MAVVHLKENTENSHALKDRVKEGTLFRKVMQLLLGNLWLLNLTDFPSHILSPAPVKESDSS